jgi:hypothetical protein
MNADPLMYAKRLTDAGVPAAQAAPGSRHRAGAAMAGLMPLQ